MCSLWLVLGALIILVLWLAYSSSCKREDFDILGALAPYEKALYQCEKSCERGDQSKRLLSSANLGCDAYCQSVFSDMATKNNPPPPVVTEYDVCKEQCSEGRYANNPIARDKCISMCSCHLEVKKWCRELQCPYSKLDPKECMKQCTANQMTNCNQVSWNWRAH